jgi:hypothetical protein
VDYPSSTKLKKYYLVIYSGIPGPEYKLPAPLMMEEEGTEKK